MMEIKICSKCNETKSINEFRKLRNQCKYCEKVYKKFLYKNNEKTREYYKIQSKKYYKNNKNNIKIKQKEYRELNPNKIKDYNEKYYIINSKEIKTHQKKYYNANIEKDLFRKAKYRANSKNLDFNITIDDIKNIMVDICPLLNIKMQINEGHQKYNSFTLDRINCEKGYVKNNIQIISNKANKSKNNSTIEEYEKIVKNLNKIIKNGITTYNHPTKNKQIRKNFTDAKVRSKKHNLPFNLTIDYLNSIYPQNNKCLLLDVKMEHGFKKLNDFSPTLDRIRPEKGYVEGNVIIISHKANRVKNNLTLKEMSLLLKNWERIINIANYL